MERRQHEPIEPSTRALDRLLRGLIARQDETNDLLAAMLDRLPGGRTTVKAGAVELREPQAPAGDEKQPDADERPAAPEPAPEPQELTEPAPAPARTPRKRPTRRAGGA